MVSDTYWWILFLASSPITKASFRRNGTITIFLVAGSGIYANHIIRHRENLFSWHDELRKSHVLCILHVQKKDIVRMAWCTRNVRGITYLPSINQRCLNTTSRIFSLFHTELMQILNGDISKWCHILYRVHGLITRYEKVCVAHAPGMPGTFSPPPTLKETAI